MALQFTARQTSRLLRYPRSSFRSSDKLTSIWRSNPIPRSASNSVARITGTRCFHVSNRQYGGLMPDTSDPKPREAEDHDQPTTATELEIKEYHKLADQYLERLMTKLEQKQEEKAEIDPEYASGVLTIDTHGKGTIVINKQPPNRQIWLASPIAGPLRFDWVVSGESMHEKEGAGSGSWVYLRDGTTLDSVLKKELGVDMELDDLHAEGQIVKRGGSV